jgi:hypothetical protein
MKVLNRRDRKQRVVARPEDIPAFQDAEAAAAWWETHEVAADLLASLPEPSAEELLERFGTTDFGTTDDEPS